MEYLPLEVKQPTINQSIFNHCMIEMPNLPTIGLAGLNTLSITGGITARYFNCWCLMPLYALLTICLYHGAQLRTVDYISVSWCAVFNSGGSH